MLFGPAARTVDITVSVMDAETDDPVPNAKVVIITESYGVFDNRQLTFVDYADDKGQLSFRQRVGYAMKSVGVVCYDQNITKRGIDRRTTYAAYPVTGPRSGKYVHFYANRGHYTIEVAALTEAERSKYQKSYDHAVTVARNTAHILGMRGLKVGE
jgi:hypothetical protein